MGADPFSWAMIGMTAASTASGIAGGHAAAQAGDRDKKFVRAYTLAREGSQLAELESGLGEQERLLKKAIRTEETGIDESIRRYESQGTKNIERERTRAMGEAKAGLASRGLSGSSVAQNLNLGISRQTSDRYTSLGEAVAGMRQALAAKQGMGMRELGQLRAYRSQSKNQIWANTQALISGQYANTQYAQRQPDLSGLGGYLALASLRGPSTNGWANSPAGQQIATAQTYQTFNKGTGLGSYI